MEEASFLSEIEKEVSHQEETILGEAEGEVKKILEEGRKEAEHLEKGLLHRTDLEIRRRRSRALTQEDLENRQALLKLKSLFLEKAVREARLQFDGLSPQEYEETLKKFLAELASSLEGHRKVFLCVRPEDEKLAKSLAKELQVEVEPRADPSVSRGVELEDMGGRFRIRNTFDSRLKQAYEEVIKRLSDLFLK